MPDYSTISFRWRSEISLPSLPCAVCQLAARPRRACTHENSHEVPNTPRDPDSRVKLSRLNRSADPKVRASVRLL